MAVWQIAVVIIAMPLVLLFLISVEAIPLSPEMRHELESGLGAIDEFIHKLFRGKQS